eukprot:TRINITY_DN50560_c0_g1_i1.p1 TRINITY_DN50560_c0_g1~~TRINITY_DN50560_c0_g1_i1.p1  ORF type:complete len:398 (-),score=84.38 TRINITY_DN50560_c0_g1_i1:49-1242(-)
MANCQQRQGLPACEICRAWPASNSSRRYLHPALRVPVVKGRGRCLVARQALAAGTLLLADSPLAVAASQEELVRVASSSAHKDAGFRQLLLSLCGDARDEEALAAARGGGHLDASLVERIVQHNCHEVELPLMDGQRTEDAVPLPECGLWPLAAVINHSLRPNVARSFVGHMIHYRLTRNVAEGEELVDNYIDPRLPREERVAFLARMHGIEDEGPDEFDAPEVLLQEVTRRLIAARPHLERGDSTEASKTIAAAVDLCRRSEVREPAFTDVLWALADLSGQEAARNLELRFRCLEEALRYATAREQHSTVSCTAAAALLRCAAEMSEESRRRNPTGVAAATARLRSVEALAREHVQAVYGPDRLLSELLGDACLSHQIEQALATSMSEVLSLDCMD